MKTTISIAMLVVLGLSFWNANNATLKFSIDPFHEVKGLPQDSYAGKVYKKVAAGQDANKNGILDEPEKMNYLEPGAYDNIHFIDKRRIKIYGMGMELYGLYKIKTEGRKTIVVISSDTTLREPLSDSPHKFEVLYSSQDTLVMIPPIYSFMLCTYVKQK